MSRTNRETPRKYIRHPKGKINALNNDVRPKAVPPDCREDLPHSDESLKIFKICQRLREKKWSDDRIIRHVRRKYGVGLRVKANFRGQSWFSLD